MCNNLISKMSFIFTVATAALLVGSHSAAADCFSCCKTGGTCAGHQPWCDTCPAGTFTAAEGASHCTCTTDISGGQTDSACRARCDVTTTATGAKCYDHNLMFLGKKLTDGQICKCDAWGAWYTCTITVPSQKTERNGGGNIGTCCTEPPCTAGANGASCQNGGTAVGTGNNCGCNCATGYEGANCQTAKACTAGANGAPCQNSGTAYGTIAAGNCGCSCLVNKQPVGFVGANCQTPKACDMYTRTCVYRNWWTGSCFVYTNIPNVGCLTAVAQARATGALSAGDDDGDGDGEEGGVVLNEDLTDTEKAEMSAGCTLFKESDGQVLPEWAAQVNESATTVITVIETICAELDVEGAAAIATLETTTTNTQPTPAGVARTVFAGIIAACGLYVVWVVARKTPPSNSNKDVLDAPENMAEISEI